MSRGSQRWFTGASYPSYTLWHIFIWCSDRDVVSHLNKNGNAHQNIYINIKLVSSETVLSLYLSEIHHSVNMCSFLFFIVCVKFFVKFSYVHLFHPSFHVIFPHSFKKNTGLSPTFIFFHQPFLSGFYVWFSLSPSNDPLIIPPSVSVFVHL